MKIKILNVILFILFISILIYEKAGVNAGKGKKGKGQKLKKPTIKQKEGPKKGGPKIQPTDEEAQREYLPCCQKDKCCDDPVCCTAPDNCCRGCCTDETALKENYPCCTLHKCCGGMICCSVADDCCKECCFDEPPSGRAKRKNDTVKINQRKPSYGNGQYFGDSPYQLKWTPKSKDRPEYKEKGGNILKYMHHKEVKEKGFEEDQSSSFGKNEKKKQNIVDGLKKILVVT